LFLAIVEQWPKGEDLPDALLMQQLLQQESRALEVLYDRYARPVYSVVLRIAQQAAAAEEIVQDVFLQLWRHADRYEASRGPLGPWLFTVARNRALDFQRRNSEKQRRREDLLEEDPVSLRCESQPEQRIDQERRAARVRAMMAELPDLQRQAIELAFFDGMSHSEIAATLAQPLGTVKSWIRGGLLRLRETMEKG
jgi:RNA polymerase sigma-70 factor (ECF subfamily)